jgi:uncharacterized membrane protein YeaQ/YmgE (transglycosylase-associated protein family)
MQTLLVVAAAAAWDTKTIIITAVIGLVAGLLARAILPGKQHMGMILTIVLGVAGAFVGQFVKSFFSLPGGDTYLWQVVFATGGALVLLILLCLFGVFKK